MRATGGLRDTVFDVDVDKARAAWELEGSSDWERDGLDATNGFSFEVRSPGLPPDLQRCLHSSAIRSSLATALHALGAVSVCGNPCCPRLLPCTCEYSKRCLQCKCCTLICS